MCLSTKSEGHELTQILVIKLWYRILMTKGLTMAIVNYSKKNQFAEAYALDNV